MKTIKFTKVLINLLKHLKNNFYNFKKTYENLRNLIVAKADDQVFVFYRSFRSAIVVQNTALIVQYLMV